MQDATETTGVVIVARVRDADRRCVFRRLMSDWDAVQLVPGVYEISLDKWNNWDDLAERDKWWSEELEKLEDLIDPRTDSVLVWVVQEGRLTRGTFGAGDLV